MFCIAWPDAPLIKLSMTETITKRLPSNAHFRPKTHLLWMYWNLAYPKLLGYAEPIAVSLA